jgi:hypothetical protein
MNKELKLLAENMSVWPSDYYTAAWVISPLGGSSRAWSVDEFNLIHMGHTKKQWQSARQELGLDSPFNPKSMQNRLKYYNNLMQNPFTSPEEDEAWADAERRMDTIGQNGNTAEHYDEPPAIEYTRTAEQFLSQAADLLIERGKQYDKPGGERSMGSTVKAFNAITNKALSESEGWLFMSLLKRVRQYQGPYHKDSAEDAVSYSALEAEALERGL